MNKTTESKKNLDAALATMSNACVLWGIRAHAVVRANDGKIYEGGNVESWVSGLGTCAERCAINHAVLHGNRKITDVAIVMDADRQSEPRPCGACLQYSHDFALNPKIQGCCGKS